MRRSTGRLPVQAGPGRIGFALGTRNADLLEQKYMIEAQYRDSGRGGVPASTATELAVREAVERIVQEVHPTRIILFGSVARRQQHPESDVDLLVVMPEGMHKRHTAQRLYRKLRGLPVAVDIIVTTESDLARHKDNPGLIYRTILHEGRQLYAA
jgi:predicted nucleotidyltransferase